jgi:ribosomal protein S18 acetylase RimI-like enzyme
MPDWELIVVDDASTNKTLGMLREQTGRDARLRLYFHKQNAGMTKTLNEGLSMAGGEYVMAMNADDFAELVLFSSPYLFPAIYGDDVKAIMRYLFCQRCNLFGFEHAYFAEVKGKIAGMLLGYDRRIRSRENWRTGFLLLKKMKGSLLVRFPQMVKVEGVIGMVDDGEYYISNIAVYPEYRNKGLGSRLILAAEIEARSKGAKTMALEVEVENAGAIKLYNRLGYSIIRESSVELQGGKPLHFHRMCKGL